MSTHFIHPPGIAQLKRWGLLGPVAASNCPPFLKMSFDLGSFALTGSPPPTDGVAEHYCPRRTVLDKILVDAAVEAGAELREGFSVQEILMDSERVAGIRARNVDGATVREEARIVVGADGMRSLVARAVGAPQYNAKPTLACAYYTYWSSVPIEGAEIYVRDRWMIIAFPTNDDLVCTFMEWPREEFHSVRTDIEGNFLKKLDFAPGFAERIRSGKREANFVGTGVLPNFFRKPYGSGWALIGDAGYHKDPYMALGITDAFRDSELLTKAIDAALSEHRPLEEALADYEQQRNVAAMPAYELNCQLASLQPRPPEMQQLFAALRENQTETDRFIGAVEGTVPIPEFFSPENVQRIISAS